MYELLIQNGERVFEPVVLDGVTLEGDRKGAPGKLTFSIIDDGEAPIEHGNQVRLTRDGAKLFFGFVFIVSRDKSGRVDITAYDQLRYLKNKETYVYENKTADALIRMIAEDFHLNVGALAGTGHNIASRVEDNKTLFDIIQSALDLTLTSTGRLYVLYDDFGALTLKDIETMQLPILLDGETGANYEYVATIDGETYNQVKLVYEDKEGGKRQIYMTKDSANIEKWGVLQYYEKINDADAGQSMADGLMALYNRVARTLTLKDVCGDVRVRAGSSVMVRLALGDMTVGSMMVAEHVKHTLRMDDHRMDLELRGGLIGA